MRRLGRAEEGDLWFEAVHAAILLDPVHLKWLDVEGIHAGLPGPTELVTLSPERPAKVSLRQVSEDEVRHAFAVMDGVTEQEVLEARAHWAKDKILAAACHEAQRIALATDWKIADVPSGRDRRAPHAEKPQDYTGKGWKPLAMIADRIWDVFDVTTPEDEEAIEKMDNLERIRRIYLNSDCGDFAVALHRLTGWPLVSVTFPHEEIGLGHHVLVRVPDGVSDGGRDLGGLLLDVSGLHTCDAIRRRYGGYGGSGAVISDPGGTDLAMGASDDSIGVEFDWEVSMAISAIRQIPWAPFNAPWFRNLSRDRVEGVDVAKPPF